MSCRELVEGLAVVAERVGGHRKLDRLESVTHGFQGIALDAHFAAAIGARERQRRARGLLAECALPQLFGFAVAVHPRDGDTAWFVPEIKDEKRIPANGRFVVTRTRDGGKTFQTLSKGLPTEPAYDIVYRHGLEVSGDGNCLVMGSTTGGVWVSEDQGDSWQALAARTRDWMNDWALVAS